MCCGIVYKGRYGEVIIDPHLYKPCCQRKPALDQEQGENEEVEEQAAENNDTGVSPALTPKQNVEVEEKEALAEGAR